MPASHPQFCKSSTSTCFQQQVELHAREIQSKEEASKWQHAVFLLAQLQNSSLLCDVVAFQLMLNVCEDSRQSDTAVKALADLRSLLWELI